MGTPESISQAGALGLQFEEQVRTAGVSIRVALIRACEACNIDASWPRQFARQMGWNHNLAWKLSRIVLDDDLFASLPLLPAAASQRTIIAGFKRMGTPPDMVDALQRAMDDFEQVIAAHAPNRGTALKMIGDLSSFRRADRTQGIRKLAFEANSAIWGVQARLQLNCQVLSPGRGPGGLDWAAVSGLVDFRRLRADVGWPIGQLKINDNAGEPVQTSGTIPLERGLTDRDVFPVVSAFSTPGLQSRFRVEVAKQTVSYHIVDGPIGTSGQLSCLIGLRRQGMDRPAVDTPNHRWEFGASVATPVEALQCIVLIHRSLVGPGEPRAECISDMLGGRTAADGFTRRALPVTESVADLDASEEGLHCDDFEDFPRLVAWIFEQLGQDRRAYRAFGLRMKHPVLSTTLYLSLDPAQS